jgi:hypothetical protein
VKRAAWNQFTKVRGRYRRETEKLLCALPDLQALQQQLVNRRHPAYPVETPIVYNSALDDSQRFMARILLEFHLALSPENAFSCENGPALPVWIIGYSEMKKGGIFEAYTNELKAVYGGTAPGNALFLYRHFSMNQFTIDLKRQSVKGEPLKKTLHRIGTAYREKFLWETYVEN